MQTLVKALMLCILSAGVGASAWAQGFADSGVGATQRLQAGDAQERFAQFLDRRVDPAKRDLVPAERGAVRREPRRVAQNTAAGTRTPGTAAPGPGSTRMPGAGVTDLPPGTPNTPSTNPSYPNNVPGTIDPNHNSATPGSPAGATPPGSSSSVSPPSDGRSDQSTPGKPARPGEAPPPLSGSAGSTSPAPGR